VKGKIEEMETGVATLTTEIGEFQNHVTYKSA
jgi:hypothetical protein